MSGAVAQPTGRTGVDAAFATGGELGALMRDLGWDATPLGPVASWPQSLVSPLSILLASKAQIVLFWGPAFAALYNDAYAPTIGDKHPHALGRPAREHWTELWDDLRPLLQGVVDSGRAYHATDRPFAIDRQGFLERVYFDVSYDPVRVEDGSVGGVFCIVSETTQRVLGARRLRLLRELEVRTAAAGGPDEVAEQAVAALADAAEDIPGVLVYLLDGERRLRLAAARDAPAPHDLGPLRAALHSGTPRRLDADAATRVGLPGPALLLPLSGGGSPVGVMVALLGVGYELPGAYREFLEAAAARTGHAVDRLRVRQAELQAASASRRMSETLQRSLLTAPPEPDHLQIAVRYHPAAHQAQIGGDWYDAFLTADGSTTLVIGDVAGHDHDAAAAMAQVRNILRGVAQTLVEPPAAVLSALDRALHGLALDTLATAVLAQVCHGPRDEARGLRVLRWCNAGHPPPLLIRPDGSAVLLQHEPGLLLGLDPETDRTDHEVALEPHSTVLLYTDGLIERRGEVLDDALERLRVAAGEFATLPVEQFCDALLARFAVDSEDDVALLVLRTFPQDRPPSGRSRAPYGLTPARPHPVPCDPGDMEERDVTVRDAVGDGVPDAVVDPDRLAAVDASGLVDTGAEEAFDRLARLASTLLGTPLAFVTIVDAERSWYKSFIGGPEGAERWGPVEASFCKYVIGTDAECIVDDAGADPLTWSNPAIDRMGVAAWAGYPVRAPGGEVLGTFCVVDTVPRTWSPDNLATLQTLAAAATAEIALRTALRDERAQRTRAEEVSARLATANAALERTAGRAQALASTLSRSLLPPRLPPVSGLDVAASYRSAGIGHDVTGDFYDVFQTGPGAWWVVIGDVCGKGPEAAALTTEIRYSLRAEAAHGGSPAEVLAAVDELLHTSSDLGERFATTALVSLRRDGQAWCADVGLAGHPHPLLRRAGGGVEPLGVPGLPLGLFGDSEFRDHRLELHAGDAVLLCTDGVTEARRDHDEYGTVRLQAVLARAGGGAARQLVAAVEAEVTAFSRGEGRDDMALLALAARPDVELDVRVGIAP